MAMRGRSARRAVAALLIAAIAAGGCGTAAPAAADGVLRFATDTQPDCLDPQVSPTDVAALIDRNIFDSLVSMTPDGVFHPWLARAWTVSPDQLTYTFTLRDDVTFTDGTRFDAAAVKATLDHAVDPKTKSQFAASLIRTYAGATVLDPGTVQVRLSAPSAAFLQALSTPYLGIQSPRSLREHAGALCQTLVGSGPFRFVSWQRNRRITLRRFDAYAWGPAGSHAGAAHLRGIEIQFVPENGVRFGMLTSGQIDVAGDIPPSDVSTLQHTRDFQLLRDDAPGGVYTVFFNTVSGPLADPRVRQALMRSVRIDELVRSVYFGQYARAWSPLSADTIDYEPGLAGTWPYDPAAAARLLDEAGWTGRDAAGYRTRDGARLTLRWPYTSQLIREQRDLLGQGIQAEAKRAGIDIQYVSEDAGAFIKDILAAHADMHAFSFERADPDVLSYAFDSGQTVDHGGGNIFHTAVPELDGLLRRAAATADPAVRAPGYRAAQRMVVERALAMPIYVPSYLAGASRRVHGLRFDAQATLLFFDVSQEDG